MDMDELRMQLSSSFYNIDLDTVKAMIKIPLEEAVKQFLSDEDYKEIVEKGFYVDVKAMEESAGQRMSIEANNEMIDMNKICAVFNNILNKDNLEPYFSKTEAGKTWYYSAITTHQVAKEIERRVSYIPPNELYKPLMASSRDVILS